MDDLFNSFMNGFDENGCFGDYGGCFVVEILMLLVLGFEVEYEKVKIDLIFWVEMDDLWKYYVGCLLFFYYVQNMIEEFGGVKIYFKCDELNYIGVYKINNVLGQIILVCCMGKIWIIVEIGVGQYGVVIVIVCVKFGL